MIEKLSLIERATRIAMVAHKNQVRKNDGSPYIVHPFMVAMNLAKHNFSDTIISAAIMHDVMEDSDFSEESLREQIGDDVIDIVKAVSEDKEIEWKERKKQYVEAVKSGPEGAKAVSIGDKIHNASSLLFAHAQEGSSIWDKFNRGRNEKIWFEELVLKMLKETWEHPLVDEYEVLVEKMRKLE